MSEFDFIEIFKNSDRLHKQQESEYARLRQNPPRNIKVGDKVLVAVGLLGRGYVWKRKECEVVEISQVSIKVKSDEKYNEWEEWIDPVLITDVLLKVE